MMRLGIIVIGTSFGGFQALKTVLGGLPADFPVPVAIVQHRNAQDSEGFSSLFAGDVLMPVIEVNDKEEMREGHIYLCPSNYHMLAERDHFALSTEAPVLNCRPSVDVLFESAAETFREHAAAVLLTGMSHDGAAGIKRIKECGGVAIVQDPVTAEGHIMPKAAIAAAPVDQILPLRGIAPFLIGLCSVQKARA